MQLGASAVEAAGALPREGHALPPAGSSTVDVGSAHGLMQRDEAAGRRRGEQRGRLATARWRRLVVVVAQVGVLDDGDLRLCPQHTSVTGVEVSPFGERQRLARVDVAAVLGTTRAGDDDPYGDEVEHHTEDASGGQGGGSDDGRGPTLDDVKSDEVPGVPTKGGDERPQHRVVTLTDTEGEVRQEVERVDCQAGEGGEGDRLRAGRGDDQTGDAEHEGGGDGGHRRHAKAESDQDQEGSLGDHMQRLEQDGEGSAGGGGHEGDGHRGEECP